MLETAIHEEAEAALNRLLVKHSDLKERLGKAYGYAVFPSVGRAGVVIGGAYGEGEVYEKGEPVGFATMSQITVGVQVGGQTFTELVIFDKKQSLDEFKHRGKLGFSANASAVIVKAAATATSSPSGVEAKAYSHGGMLLELSLGGSNFLFVPPLVKPDGKASVEKAPDGSKNKEESEVKGEQNQEQNKNSEQEISQEKNNSNEKSHEEESQGSEATQTAHKGILNKVKQMPKFVGSTALKLAHQGLKRNGKGSVLKKAGDVVSGLQKEQTTNRILHQDIQGALKMIEENNSDFKQKLDNAYAYAVFPAIGRASLVLGGSFGKGEVFEQGKLIGYAGLVQVTLGVQVGGETVTEVVIFSDKSGLDRFKKNKLAFAANASAVIVKAGAGITNSYQSGKIYTFSEGGLLIEAVIGVQKFIFRSAALTRGKSVEDESGLKKAA